MGLLIRGLTALLMTENIAILFVFLLSIYIWKKVMKMASLPPGPSGYPIVGIIPLIKKEFHLLLFDYSKKFGNILSLKMGRETVVVLSDYKVIKKAFQSRDFTARPKSELSNLLGGYGVVNSEGALWKSQRRYLLNQKLGMRHWNSGHGNMHQIENVVQREVIFLLQTIVNEHKDKPFNPAPLLNCGISNVICSILMSTRFQYKDPKFQRFMFLFDEGFRLFTMTGAMIFLPFLKLLPGIANACEELKKNREEMILFVRDIIENHRKELDYSNPKDLIDTYLIEMQRRKEEDTEDEFFHGYNPDEQLEQLVLDLFSASVETLKTSVLWSIVFMLHNPGVKEKIQRELSEVVGNERLPNIEDMNKLQYTRAALYEIMRRSSVVPMGTTHATEREVSFEGYTIPQNSHVIPLLHAVHMNPENWDNPDEFRPERFLNEEGLVHKPEHFMPFGVGQRMCLGDQLAEKEFFLFFTSILHVFDLAESGDKLPSLKGVAGVTVTPDEFEVTCSIRNLTPLVNSSQNLILSSKANADRLYG